mgnify:CR=1 FL=1
MQATRAQRATQAGEAPKEAIAPVTAMQRYFNMFDDRGLALGLFTIAEDMRVDARTAVEYGGIRRWREYATRFEPGTGDLPCGKVILRSYGLPCADPEAILRAYEAHGPACVEKLRGMFAFALWDAERRGLLLARDPFGIKPLYLADDGRTLRAASQVKALLAGGGVDTVWSSINYSLGANLENLRLTGDANLGTGNGLNNVIEGKAVIDPNGVMGIPLSQAEADSAVRGRFDLLKAGADQQYEVLNNFFAFHKKYYPNEYYTSEYWRVSPHYNAVYLQDEQ